MIDSHGAGVADDSTLGGYVAVHGRPPSFGGVDGAPYSVDVVVDETGDAAAPIGAYLLFIQWAPGGDAGGATIHGHRESDFLARGASEDDVRAALARMPLLTVKATLDAVIRRDPSSAA